MGQGMSRTLSITLTRKIQMPPPPAGYSVRTVREWADPVMTAAGYDTTLRGAVGQFQVVTCYVTDGAGNWCGTWSAIQNYNRLSHADMMEIARSQVAPFGYAWSDAELMANQTQMLPDGFTLKQKLGWLYEPNPTQPPGLEMWGLGEWYETSEGRFGAMVNGGQQVAVSAGYTNFPVKMPNEDKVRVVSMQKLLTFRRSDWGKSHAGTPYLVQKATTADYPSNRYGEQPRGYVFVPAALDPQDFDFSGAFPAREYYLPAEWLK